MVIDTAAIIPIIVGVYATMNGFGLPPRKAARLRPSTKKILKWLGPIVIIFGLFLLFGVFG